jgi:hypothetical protein
MATIGCGPQRRVSTPWDALRLSRLIVDGLRPSQAAAKALMTLARRMTTTNTL